MCTISMEHILAHTPVLAFFCALQVLVASMGFYFAYLCATRVHTAICLRNGLKMGWFTCIKLSRLHENIRYLGI
jgi:hypothetical protein